MKVQADMQFVAALKIKKDGSGRQAIFNYYL